MMFWNKERKIFGYCLLKLQNQEKTQKRNSWVEVSPQVAVSTGPAGTGFQCSSVENCDCRGKQPWRPWALLGLSLYLFLVTFYFWGYLTTGFENNIDRGWLHTNTKQIPQLTGSLHTECWCLHLLQDVRMRKSFLLSRLPFVSRTLNTGRKW